MIGENGKVFVLTDDGFEIPVAEKELVFYGTHEYPEGNQTGTQPVSEPERDPGRPDQAVPMKSGHIPRNVPLNAPVAMFLGFIPENPGPAFNNTLSCYLINDSGYAAYYHLGMKEAGAFYYLASGLVEADTKCYIRSFDQTGISKISDIHAQLILVNDGKYQRKEVFDKMVNLNLVNFSKESYYRENDFFKEKAVLFSIITESLEYENQDIKIPQDIKAIKEDPDANREEHAGRKEPVTDTMEVDLHMDALALKNSQITPSGIMALQMSRFHAAVEEALSRKFRRLVIIHGMGQGTLKMQIRKELQEKYPQFLYQDASFKEYGFGATMVYLKNEKRQ